MNAFQTEVRKLVYWLSEDVNPAPKLGQVYKAQLVQCLQYQTQAERLSTRLTDMGLGEEAQDIRAFIEQHHTRRHIHDLDVMSFRKILNWLIGESSICPTANLDTKEFLVTFVANPGLWNDEIHHVCKPVYWEGEKERDIQRIKHHIKSTGKKITMLNNTHKSTSDLVCG